MYSRREKQQQGYAHVIRSTVYGINSDLQESSEIANKIEIQDLIYTADDQSNIVINEISGQSTSEPRAKRRATRLGVLHK